MNDGGKKSAKFEYGRVHPTSYIQLSSLPDLILNLEYGGQSKVGPRFGIRGELRKGGVFMIRTLVVDLPLR
jgi:hypothetical protein